MKTFKTKYNIRVPLLRNFKLTFAPWNMLKELTKNIGNLTTPPDTEFPRQLIFNA